MSVFSPVKTIILANLSNTMPADLRKAVVESMEALDNDLDVGNYIPSSVADDKFEKFHTVLAGIDEIGKEDEDAEKDEDEDNENEVTQGIVAVDEESEEDESEEDDDSDDDEEVDSGLEEDDEDDDEDIPVDAEDLP